MSNRTRQDEIDLESMKQLIGFHNMLVTRGTLKHREDVFATYIGLLFQLDAENGVPHEDTVGMLMNTMLISLQTITEVNLEKAGQEISRILQSAKKEAG